MNSTLVSTSQALTATRSESSAKKKTKSELDTQDFLNLLATQLANQNPLEPMSDAEYYAQIAQLGTTQGIDRLNTKADVEQAQSLMGKTVTAVRPNSATDPTITPTVTGVVTKMVSREGEYKIGIQESNGNVVEVKLDAVQSIEPYQNLADYAHLIGKKIEGLDASGLPIQGEATGLDRADGKIRVQVKKADGSTINLNPADLTKIG